MGEQSFSRRFKKGIREWVSVIPFLLIGTVLFILFVLYPQIKNIYISFTNYSIMPGAKNEFVGLANYRKIFTDIHVKGSDAYFFWMAFRNNILAILITVPGQLILGLLVAVFIHNLRFGKNIYKILIFKAICKNGTNTFRLQMNSSPKRNLGKSIKTKLQENIQFKLWNFCFMW